LDLAKQSRSGARRGGNPALKLAAIRRFHSYFGAFIAPSILFFALTGSLQLFTLHEAHGDYRPPAVIEKLGMLHKDQVFAAKPKRPAPAAAQAPKPAAPSTEAHHDAGPKTSTLALKWFFLFIAASLVVSTCLGLWMALAYSANKGVLWLAFLAGAAIPVAILLI
jgi:hypothetical protein